MIVSDQYQYVFVELSHTASTALHAEFCEYYGGQEILRKHAKYDEFLRIAKDKKDYQVIAGMRNPLDVFVSVYHKYKNNHKGNYTDPDKLRVNGGWVTQDMLKQYEFVQESQHDFAGFLRTFYRLPYYDYKCYAARNFDAIIRYENLQEDFSRVLKDLGIEQIRDLPLVNPTSGKGIHFLEYYPEELRPHVMRVFGPCLIDCGYSFPTEWGDMKIPITSRFLYSIIGLVKNIYWKYIRNSSLYLSLRGLPQDYGTPS